MSLNTNITNLQEILDKVNNLPEASTAPNIETCTIQIVENGYDYFGDEFLIAYSKLVEGIPVTVVLSHCRYIHLQDPHTLLS